MTLAYFAPLDSHGGLLVWLFGSGIGSNIGASLIWTALAAGTAAVLWPPTRKALHRFADTKLTQLHLAVHRLGKQVGQQHSAALERHDDHTDHLDRLEQSILELHAKLDHHNPA